VHVRAAIGSPDQGGRLDFWPLGNGAGLASAIRENYPVVSNNDFSKMHAPALVITGDPDFNESISARKDWRADAYTLSPAPKSSVMLHGAGHMPREISGYDAKTSDENPKRGAATQRFTWA